MKIRAEERIANYLYVFRIIVEELSRYDDRFAIAMAHSIQETIDEVESLEKTPELNRQILSGFRQGMRDISSMLALSESSESRIRQAVDSRLPEYSALWKR